MLDICLVKTPVPELQDDRLDPPMGLLYLGTVLKEAGLKVKILDLSGIPEPYWIFPEARSYGFSTYTASYNRTVRIKNLVKELYPSVRTIAGGPHASVRPSEVILEFDNVIRGEGEVALLYLITGNVSRGIIDGHNVPIDEIPMPDYSLVDIPSYTREYLGKSSFQLFSSRGCPYDCGFCSKLPEGSRLRQRSIANVLDEINMIRENYGDVSFRIKDDLFASSRKLITALKESGVQIEYSCNIRADYVVGRHGLADKLRESGCRTACMGVESGSDKVLRRMRKRITRQQNIDAIRLLKSAGIQVLTWIIVGYPGETHETLYETISLLEETQPDLVRAYPLIPYPGTEVYDQVEIMDYNYDNYFYIYGNNEHGFVYQTPELPRGEIMGMWETLNRYLKKFEQRVEGS